jgi:hypothetical protein
MTEDNLGKFWKEQGEWSQATFGPDAVRGPLGPLTHLAREVLTELLGVPRTIVDWVLDKAELGAVRVGTLVPKAGSPELLEELIDAQFLLIDASRRAGFTYEQYVEILFAKLAKNKARKWPAFDPNKVNEAVEHDRSAEPPIDPKTGLRHFGDGRDTGQIEEMIEDLYDAPPNEEKT